MVSLHFSIQNGTYDAQKVNLLPPNTVLFDLCNDELNLWYSKPDVNVSRLQHFSKKILTGLARRGFNVYSWDLLEDGKTLLFSEEGTLADAHVLQGIWRNYKRKQAKKHHRDHCLACQEKDKKADSSSLKSVETLVDRLQEYRATFTISGMTCAACSNSVSEVLEGLLGQGSQADEPNFSVNLLLNSAVVIIPNKQIVNKVISAVEVAGFGCQLVEVLPIQRLINTKITAVIGGITCAACVNSVVSAVQELPFVLDAGVNAVTKSGQFIVEETAEKTNIQKLRDTVESCGFDFDLVKEEKINFTSAKNTSRTINIGVEGMFCTECPDLIMSYLESFGSAVVIEDPITLDQPLVKFTYIPHVDQGISVRRFMADLNHLQPKADGYFIDKSKPGQFKCQLVEAVSLDEHLRKISKQEMFGILYRLVLATVFAIPTFVFGIVGMSLLSKSNSFRIWLERPIWVGNVSRVVWIVFFLSTPVYFFAADKFHVKAFKEVRALWIQKNSWKKRIFKFGSMSLLMCLGTTVSYFASVVLLILLARQSRHSEMGLHTTYFDSVVFLTFFLLIGRLLEHYSKSKTADAVASLSKLKATEATVVTKEVNKEGAVLYVNDELVSVKLLDSGDFIRISTGESPAVDCVIVQGGSEFDESALTGESRPVKHIEGHQIFSGTVNVGLRTIVARILNIGGDSLIDQIVSTVRDGQMLKAPVERVADVLTGYFVPIIVLLAILTWVIWLVLAYSGALPDSYLDIDVGGWTVWCLEFAIAVFVIACPCGIGLAAPTALFVGSGLAAKNGILAKGGGAAFQVAANIGVVCFDKTGTLTQGNMSVTDAVFIGDKTIKNVAFQTARDLELSSKHPIASAVRNYLSDATAMKEGVTLESTKYPNIETIPGHGIQAVADESWTKYGKVTAILGNEALLSKHNVKVSTEQQEILTTWKRNKKSVVNVAIQCEELFDNTEFNLVCMFAVRDEIRPEAKKVIEFLHNKGVDCYIITGDNKMTADVIAQELGIPQDRVISEVVPDEKQARVSMLKKKTGAVVAMVGDGINDAPALATADVGVALSSGTDLAVTSSDFILINKSHPLIALCTLLDLAKVVFRRVRFNFGWSLVYNAIGIPIAAGVIYPYKNLRLSPVWASAAMALSSISVVMSSLLLRLYKPKIRASDFADIDAETMPVEVILLEANASDAPEDKDLKESEVNSLETIQETVKNET